MGKFGSWFKRVIIGEPPEDAGTGMIAQPIVINPNDVVLFQLSVSRINAIKNHIEQAEHVSAERMREFFTETVKHADILLKAERIGIKEYDSVVNFIHKRL
jgi:hypothetical protein